MASQDVGKIVREVIEAWNAKDLDRCASHAHADAQVTMVPFGATTSYREYIENWARAFPDGKIEVRRIVCQGDDVSAEYVGRGTHTGSLHGPKGDLPATNRRVELQFVEASRYRDGKLAEARQYFDAFSLFTQLGVGAPMQGASAGASAQPEARH
jgi:predicted ester cyclase